MPIVDITSLPFSKEFDLPPILKSLNIGLAEVLKIRKEHVWSYWNFVDPGNYSVGDETAEYPTANSHSPVVRIIAFEGRNQIIIESLLKTAAKILTKELGIDIGNIFIYYQEVSTGRVFDGGEIIRKKQDNYS